MAAVIKKTIEGGGERKQREPEKVFASSGSRRNKDLHTVIAKQVERAGHTF